MTLLPLPFPSKTISLDYGNTTFPYSATDPHNGTDFSSRSNGVVAGTPILASGDGIVHRSRHETGTQWPTIDRPNRNAGNSIDVDYPDHHVRVRYMHRPDGCPSPKTGDRVKLGTSLGVIGATGYVFGAHLHMEAWDLRTGKRVSPWRFFTRTLTVADALAQRAGNTSKPIIPTPALPEEEDDDMARNSGATYTRKSDKKVIHLVYNTDSGFQHEFGSGKTTPMSAAYLERTAKLHDIPHGFQEITEAHAGVIKKGLAAVRPAGAPSDLTVTLIDEE